MESGSAAGKRGRAAGREKAKVRFPSAPPRRRGAADLTPQERRAAAVHLFMDLALSDAEQYNDMTEEEVVEEYRRVGKLHRYDPDKEWQKRLARVARKCPPPEGLIPEIDDYLKLLEDDEKDDQVAKSGRENK